MIELDVLSKADVAADGQPRQWRSLAQRERSQAFETLAAQEFHPAATAPDAGDGPSGDGVPADPVEEGPVSRDPSRRDFMKVLAASMALAGVGLTGCRRPVEKILPYARQPEEVIPGIANFYATAMPVGDVVHPLLVESHEGRPTKIEGNPEHPAALGKSSLFAQASILNLYDPDRARVVRRQGAESTWAEFAAFARQLDPSARLVVLAEPTSSPTVLRLRQQLLGRFAEATWITYRPGGDDPQTVALGAGIRPLYRFSQAQTIVAFDADFLSDPAAGVWNSREYAQSRRVFLPDEPMSRLYVIESTMTPTGGMADHRLRRKASDVARFALAVGAALGEAVPAGAPLDERAQAFLEAIVEDAQAGPTVFVAGPTQPPAVHALCARLNARLGGGAVTYLATGLPEEAPLSETLPELASRLRAGQVDVLVTLGVNPVYDAPAALDFAEAMGRAGVSIHLGLHRDETAVRATWALPRAHYLEAWGDGRALDGTLSVIQPLIAPLYEAAHSEIELLNLLATGQDVPGYDLVRETMRQGGFLAGNFEDAWRTALHDGFVPNTAFAATAAPAPAIEAPALPAGGSDRIELVVRPDPKLGYGLFSNNAWMLELPDPVSKVVWDNVAAMSPATARRLGVRFQDGSVEGGVVHAGRIHASVVAITTPDGQRVELPAWVQPGHPDDAITVTAGWGRRYETDRTLPGPRSLFDRIFTVDTDHYRFGPIGNGIGQNVAPLRPTLASAVVPSVEVEVTARRYLVATTQDHGLMEGRPIVRMATLEQFRARPHFAGEAVDRLQGVPWESFPLAWGEERSAKADPRIGEAMYSQHQWGMTVDLNACSGCNACVIACQAENNIPVVGKEQVARSREMHWLRLDRYYIGDDVDEPGMAIMPMMCQHCEYAPCEAVCPVTATSHSPDGLNEMTYNRCIGTRYCSNNCPYKIRRFNWFNWNKRLPLETRMQLNPNVTTRFRGVMEKCTWCVHRIRKANQYAHIEGRMIEDGEVQTACQQACPSDAIVFGDILDPNSRVSQLKRTARRYEFLEEYNIRPRLSYLARLSNPNPRLAAALGGTPVEREGPVPTASLRAADAPEA